MRRAGTQSAPGELIDAHLSERARLSELLPNLFRGYGQGGMSERHQNAQRLGGIIQDGFQVSALAGIVGEASRVCSP